MTYRQLNQIFYENNKFDTPNQIIKLEPFFYDIHNLVTPIQTNHDPENQHIKEPLLENNIPIKLGVVTKTVENYEIVKDDKMIKNEIKIDEKKQTKPNEHKVFEPKQTDSIFWCIFVCVYGYSEYLMVGSRYGNRELEEKQKMISFFKENPKALKGTNHKITNGNIQEIYAEYLSFQNETTLLGVIGLAVFYNIRILLVDGIKKIYMDFHTTEPCKTCVLFKNTGIRGKTKYSFDMSITEEKIEVIQKTMLCLEHYTKPLRAISTYKTIELEEISNLLGICNEDTDKRMKKQDFYKNISEYCGAF